MDSKSRRGAKIKESSGFSYYTMSRGKFVKRVKEQTARSEERTLSKGENAGKVVHEEKVDELTGELLDIRIEEHEQYGSFWEFVLDMTQNDGEDDIAILKLQYSSGYAKDILKRLPNVDFSNDITLTGYCFTPKGKDKEKMGISLSQWNGSQDKKIFPAYTREEPNGMPELEKVKIKGKMEWDDSAIMEFLEVMVEEDIKPNLSGLSNSKEKTEQQVEKVPERPQLKKVEDNDHGDGEEVDIPF
jgi:hypothetical protein